MTSPPIQTRGGEAAKHEDGDTKNVISSSHSGVPAQYGSSISGDWSFKSLQIKRSIQGTGTMEEKTASGLKREKMDCRDYRGYQETQDLQI